MASFDRCERANSEGNHSPPSVPPKRRNDPGYILARMAEKGRSAVCTAGEGLVGELGAEVTTISGVEVTSEGDEVGAVVTTASGIEVTNEGGTVLHDVISRTKT